ncbi:MAG: tetratricopeptide repeat protein [Chloracidobacterium sp.]|nr:tetratricopeptide repeat protein [Chloracidobacterium sp.]
MKRLALFVMFVSMMSGCSSCNRNATNSNSEVNANVAAESSFANITDANVALAEGTRLLDENQTELAIEAFRQAVKINPELAEGWFQLGIAYALLEMQLERSGEYSAPASNSKEGVKKTNSEKAFEKAVETYKKWLKANPNDDAAQFNLGRTYAKLNKDEEAEEAFREAVELKPEDTEYQTELGAVLIKLAKYREAIDPLKKAVALDESNSRAIDLLEDAEAGRQRLDYVPPKNTNSSSANTSANTTANANANSKPNSNSNQKPSDGNTKPQKDEVKKPAQSSNRPR